MTTARNSVNDTAGEAQKRIFQDPAFAQRYIRVEQFTGSYASDLLDQLELGKPAGPVNFVDLACGTGFVTQHALQKLNEGRAKVRALPEDRFTFVDIAAPMLQIVKSRIETEQWPLDVAQVQLLEASMKETGLESGTYSHVVCNFGPCAAPNPEQTLWESFRILKSGGQAGWTGWANIGWHPYYVKAFEDIRNAAVQICSEGRATEEDRKLSNLPEIPAYKDLINGFAGIDLQKLTNSGVKDEDLPRWDDGGFFRTQVEKAGFVNVKVEIVAKDSEWEYDQVIESTGQVVSILQTRWTDSQREYFKDVDVTAKVEAWWKQRIMQDDVVDGKLAWKDNRAMLVTGMKP